MRPRTIFRAVLAIAALGASAACSSTGSPSAADLPVRIARLGESESGDDGLAKIQREFSAANPGYAVTWRPGLRSLEPEAFPRAVFVQGGAANARLKGYGDATSPVTPGDLVWLPPGAAIESDAPIDVLAFFVPVKGPDTGTPPPPAFIRPDWDPRITDTPGGCAEETGAYRRILLTWRSEVGPYLDHRINAHRVRITDSLTHYHPKADGFDEFYLVQAAPTGARLLVSEHVDLIEHPGSVAATDVTSLLRSVPLAAGDLIYIPRGVAHRGLGGAVVQVITVPGFRPGAEIGLDHHLRAINERLSLQSDVALPFHAPASAGPVRR